MDERVASMREFVANFWISETLRGRPIEAAWPSAAALSSSSREPHLCTSH